MPAPPLWQDAELERLSTPEQLDQYIELTDRRSWLLILAVGLAVAAALVWAFTGSVTTMARGRCLLVAAGGTTVLRAPFSGTLGELAVTAGDELRAGQAVAVVYADDQSTRAGARDTLRAGDAAQVVEVLAAAGARVSAGQRLALVEDGRAPLAAIAYVPLADGKRVRPGMEVRLVAATQADGGTADLRGRVSRVSRAAASRESMLAELGNETLVDDLLRGGPVLAVHVQLQAAAGDARGRASGNRADALTSGTPCTAGIVLDRRPLVNVIAPGRGVRRPAS